MRGVIVAIDLETTGLDSSTDRIIEIGAVKFQDNDILETYTTLVDPEIAIPNKITAITGIRQDMLLGAPKLVAVLPKLKQFVGDAVVLGHNIDFDLRFLHKQGVLENNVSLDTYELASVLLPAAPRYNLNALMQLLNLQPEGEYHRALADAHATRQVYSALWQKLLNEIPFDLLSEITRASEALPWRGLPAFTAAYQERSTASQAESPLTLENILRPLADPLEPLTATQRPTMLDLEQLASLIQPESDQQADMIIKVGEAFNAGEHMLIEAITPTNSARTAAYLLPAVMWSKQTGEHIVIATATDELQNQLLEQDIPALEKALGFPIRATALKSRANYLCPRRLAAMRRTRPTSIDELRVLAKIQTWLYESQTEDCSAVSLRGPAELNTWLRLTAQDEICTMDRCEQEMNGVCPFYKACRMAESAHIIVANQALLIADAMSNQPVLPEFQHIVIDEAHKFEESVTVGLSFRLDLTTLKQLFATLGTESTGLLGSILSETHAALPENNFNKIHNFVVNLADAVDKMGYHADNLFKAIIGFLEATDNLNAAGDFLMQIRLTRQLRDKQAFGQVQTAWSTLSQFTNEIADALTRLAKSLVTLRERYPIPHIEDLISGTNAAAQHLIDTYRQLNALIAAPDENMIYWIDVGQETERLSLRAAPLRVAPLIQQYLWNVKKMVIMCSATLRVGGSFDYICSRLGAADTVREVTFAHPFKHEQPILIYLPTDMPDPQDRNHYQQYVERGIIELAAATEGRLLAVFTSFTQLRQVTQNITARLGLGNIAVFDQSDGTSRQALLEGFKNNPRSVLLGTSTLWEGIELPYNDLTSLVIVRLPFAVPSEPVFAARTEILDDAFNQHTLPDAVLRFRQSVDQLLRARLDRSIIAIFDKRLTSKQYGQVFIDSLPPSTVNRGVMADIGSTARAWLHQP